MFDYVFAKGEGNKGASYKRTWKPEWRLPPGVKGGSVALQVIGLCVLGIAPVMWITSSKESKEKQPDIYMIQKQKSREERMRWIESDVMPQR